MGIAGSEQDRYVTVGDLRLHCLDWPRPGMPTLLLIAGVGGLGGVARQWAPFAAAMADRYRVLAPEMRGHGHSGRVAADAYTWERVLADLDAVLDMLAPGMVDLIGHSAGGAWAYLYAATRPERVRRLVIGDMGLPPSPGVAENLAALALGLRWASVAEAAEWVRARYGVHASLAAWLPVLMAEATEEAGDGARRWRQDPAVWLRLLHFLAPPPTEARRLLGAIRAPSLLVRGAESGFLSRAEAELVAAAIPDCRLVEVPAAGHVVHLANPDGFLAAVRPFLAAPGP